jgi:hypothetical protein
VWVTRSDKVARGSRPHTARALRHRTPFDADPRHTFAMGRPVLPTLAALACAVLASATHADSGVFVNGQPLEALKRQKMERAYGMPILPGRYWYDPVSGAWGLEGGPTIGRIHPNMAIGGDLRADASKGRTGVFVNGRQLHQLDVDALNRCWPLARGRYWVHADGVGGREGRPASFNLKQSCGDDAKGMGNGGLGAPPRS